MELERIDWKAIKLDGMAALLDALRVVERNQETLSLGLDVLRASLPIGARLETVWFRRYSELMGVLWRAGMPAELDGEQIGAWVRERIGSCYGSGIDGARGRGRVDGDGEAGPVTVGA